MLVDQFQRRVNYLRLSVTDRCNLRCQYCMPEEGMQWLPSETLLQDDEIITLLQDVYVPLGVNRIRLTGGEPLLRKGIVGLVSRIVNVQGIEELALTTNGVFLAPMAEHLARAGLRRVNISVDSLKPDRFKTITRGGDLAKVLAGVEAASAAGMIVKLNMLVIPGSNEDELLDFASYTIDRPVQVRYIEMMPLGGDKDFYDQHQFLPIQTMIDRISEHFALEDAKQAVPGNGPAKILRIPGAKGTLGFISPMSNNFCHACNRTRLSADGQIKACLMRPHEMDLLGKLRTGATPEEMRGMVMKSLEEKPFHHEWGAGLPVLRTMSRIGG